MAQTLATPTPASSLTAASFGAARRIVPASLGGVEALAFGTRSDGSLLLASGGVDRTVRLWDPSSGAELAELVGHRGTVWSLAFGTRGDGLLVLASAGYDGSIRLWDPTSRTRLARLDGHTGPVRTLCFGTRADGSSILASAGHDGVIRLWKTGTGELAGLLDGRAGPVHALSFGLRDGRTVLTSGGVDGVIRVWDVGSLARLPDIEGHAGLVHALATTTTPDGTAVVASGGADGRVRLWDSSNGSLVLERSASGPVHDLTFGSGPAGRPVLAAADGAGSVGLWDASSGALVAGLRRHDRAARALVIARRWDGSSVLASAGDDGEIRLWEPALGTEIATLTGHTGLARAVTAGQLPDGSAVLACGGYDRRVRLWGLAGESLGQLDAGSEVMALAVAALGDGRTVLAAAGADGATLLWDVGLQVPVTRVRGHDGPVHAVAVAAGSGGPLLATAGQDGGVRLWDVETGLLLQDLVGHAGPVRALALAPGAGGDLQVVSAGDDGLIRLWDSASGVLLAVMAGHQGPVRAVALDIGVDGSSVVVSSGFDGTIRVWDPVTGLQLHQIVGHTGPVRALALGTGSDGALLLASGGNDGAVAVWDIESGLRVAQAPGHTQPVWSVAFGQRLDGSLVLASTGADGTLMVCTADDAKTQPLQTISMRSPTASSNDQDDPNQPGDAGRPDRCDQPGPGAPDPARRSPGVEVDPIGRDVLAAHVQPVIEDSLRRRSDIAVLLDGRSGSGRSTLSRLIADRLASGANALRITVDASRGGPSAEESRSLAWDVWRAVAQERAGVTRFAMRVSRAIHALSTRVGAPRDVVLLDRARRWVPRPGAHRVADTALGTWLTMVAGIAARDLPPAGARAAAVLVAVLAAAAVISGPDWRRISATTARRPAALGIAVAAAACAALAAAMVLLPWDPGAASLDQAGTRWWVVGLGAGIAGAALHACWEVSLHARPRRPLVLVLDELDRCRARRVVRLLDTLHASMCSGTRTRALLTRSQPALLVALLPVDGRWVRASFHEVYAAFDDLGSSLRGVGSDVVENLCRHSVVVPPLDREQMLVSVGAERVAARSFAVSTAMDAARKDATPGALADRLGELIREHREVMPPSPELARRCARAWAMLRAVQGHLHADRPDLVPPAEHLARAAILLVRYPDVVDRLLSLSSVPVVATGTLWAEPEIQRILAVPSESPLTLPALARCYGRTTDAVVEVDRALTLLPPPSEQRASRQATRE